MNERIQALAEQAGFIDRGTNHTAYMNFDHEKFAQLIIEECLRMCDCADVSLLEHNYPREADGTASVKIFIKDWFGVEE